MLLTKRKTGLYVPNVATSADKNLLASTRGPKFASKKLTYASGEANSYGTESMEKLSLMAVPADGDPS